MGKGSWELEDLYKRCDRCDGQGKYVGLVTVENPCTGCEGEGKVSNPEAVRRLSLEIATRAMECWGFSFSGATEATKAFSAKLSDTCAEVNDETSEKASKELSYVERQQKARKCWLAENVTCKNVTTSRIPSTSCVTNVSPEDMEDYVTGLREALARWRSERYPDAVCIPAPSEVLTVQQRIRANAEMREADRLRQVTKQSLQEQPVKFHRVFAPLFEITESDGSDE